MMLGCLLVIWSILIKKTSLAHFEAKGHSKISVSAFMCVECCEEGTELIKMDAQLLQKPFLHQIQEDLPIV